MAGTGLHAGLGRARAARLSPVRLTPVQVVEPIAGQPPWASLDPGYVVAVDAAWRQQSAAIAAVVWRPGGPVAAYATPLAFCATTVEAEAIAIVSAAALLREMLAPSDSVICTDCLEALKQVGPRVSGFRAFKVRRRAVEAADFVARATVQCTVRARAGKS